MALNILKLTQEEFLLVINKIEKDTLSKEKMNQDFRNGAPMNGDGTINLLNYTAWLIKHG